jgi:hypothetical protein
MIESILTAAADVPFWEDAWDVFYFLSCYFLSCFLLNQHLIRVSGPRMANPIPWLATLCNWIYGRVYNILDYIHNLDIPDILEYICPLAGPSRFVLVWARCLYSYCVYSRILYVYWFWPYESRVSIPGRPGFRLFTTFSPWPAQQSTAIAVSNSYRCVVVPLATLPTYAPRCARHDFGNRLRKFSVSVFFWFFFFFPTRFVLSVDDETGLKNVIWVMTF